VHKRCLAGRRCELCLQARAATNAKDFEIGDKAARVSNNDDQSDQRSRKRRARLTLQRCDRDEDGFRAVPRARSVMMRGGVG
jgi:hypothetical protein